MTAAAQQLDLVEHFAGVPRHDPGGRIRIRWPADSVVTASFSPCERFRWELREVWNPALPLWLWLILIRG